MQEESLSPQPQTKKELATAYGISRRTLNVWLRSREEEIGPSIGRTYTPRQVEIIYRIFGHPGKKNK